MNKANVCNWIKKTDPIVNNSDENSEVVVDNSQNVLELDELYSRKAVSKRENAPRE